MQAALYACGTARVGAAAPKHHAPAFTVAPAVVATVAAAQTVLLFTLPLLAFEMSGDGAGFALLQLGHVGVVAACAGVLALFALATWALNPPETLPPPEPFRPSLREG